MTLNLQDRFVFMAASYPRSIEGDSQEIASAVKALVAAVFHAQGKILFGGHPTISPLVLMMAREFGERKRIEIYQSRVFHQTLSEATLRLRDEGYGTIVETDIAADELKRAEELDRASKSPHPDDFRQSLTIMRRAMLSQARTNPAAGVFIGGDKGLFEERTLFTTSISGSPVYAVGAPGGVAGDMAKEQMKSSASELAAKLATSRNYLSLMQDVVADIANRLGTRTATA